MLDPSMRAQSFPPFPFVTAETGDEGKLLMSMPGHRMVFNSEPDMAGVEIETPEGMLISFSGRHALERFIEECGVSVDEAAALRAIDARADSLRSLDTWMF